MPNFARIKQAVWDAFAGTAQPTFAESGGFFAAPPAAPPLTLFVDETGWQAAIPPDERHAYTGRENSKTVSEAMQARIYGDLVRFVECDPSVSALDLFHLVDEFDLDRFQSGLVRADGTRRPSYDAVKSAIADTGGLCSGIEAVWRHSMGVAGAAARFAVGRRFEFGVSAKEAAGFRAGIFRAAGRRLSESDRGAMAAALASSGPAPGLVSRVAGTVRAYWPARVVFPARSLAPGWYVYAVRLAASMNPSRTALRVGTPFRVG